jgi:hypothetical protein
MEGARYIRIALPPFVLIGMVLLADFLAGCLEWRLAFWAHQEILIAITGIVAASVIPVGFVIGGLSLVTLGVAELVYRLTKKHRTLECFPHLGHGQYRLVVGEAFTDLVLPADISPKDATPADRLHAMQRFIYGNEENKWLQDHVDRLWAASIAYWGAFIALPLSWIAARCLMGIKVSCSWWVVTALLAVLFVAMWHDSRKKIQELEEFEVRTNNGVV